MRASIIFLCTSVRPSETIAAHLARVAGSNTANIVMWLRCRVPKRSDN